MKTNEYPSMEEAKANLRQRQEQTSRICAFKGFGKKEPHTCNCTGEQIKKCKQNYKQIKKEQYVDSKGQHCFTEDK